MALKLQRRNSLRTLHIALFLFVILCTARSVKAQTVLLPGDIAFVSVNSSDNSFEIVPLIDLESGTQFMLSNATWNQSDMTFSDSLRLKIKLNSEIQAGSILRFGRNILNDAFTAEGELSIDGLAELLYIYQAEDNAKRFVSGIAWGDPGLLEKKLESLPDILRERTDAFLRLGASSDYQYYIRNGASGTPSMLLEFIYNPQHWRAKDGEAFSPIATSFSLLSPPVVLFDESRSVIDEDGQKAYLNVSIYEHDGSKLTVDVMFDTTYSTATKSDLRDFVSRRINFTGLIGNAVYEVEIPVKDNDEYTGNKTGIFSLQNLSNGHFGDFLTHTLIIQDDELPVVQFDLIRAQGESFLIIHNLENSAVDFTGWTLKKGKSIVEIPEGTVIPSTRYLAIFGHESLLSGSETAQKMNIDESEPEFLSKAGLIELINSKGEVVTDIRIKEIKADDRTIFTQSDPVPDTKTGVSNQLTTNELTTTETLNDKPFGFEGWQKALPSDVQTLGLKESDLFFWDVSRGRFRSFDTAQDLDAETELLAYLDKDQATVLLRERLQRSKLQSEAGITLRLSAFDTDNNGIIDQAEGLNLQYHSGNSILPVEMIFDSITEAVDVGEADVRVYRWNLNENRSFLLRKADQIYPGEWFFIQLKRAMEEHKIEINPGAYSPNQQQVLDEKPEGNIILELSGEGFNREIHFNFRGEESNSYTSRTTLDGLDEILISGVPYASFYLENNNDRFSVLELGSEPGNSLSYDLKMVASRSGSYTLNVKNWDHVSQDWMIILKDNLNGREYILDENWSLNFDYVNASEERKTRDLTNPPDPEPLGRFTVTLMSREKYFRSEEADLPKELDLHQNYPNPFNPVTTISFYLPENSEVRLSVFNIVGQPVAELVNGSLSAGEHTVEWDASDMPSGMYIYQLEVGSRIMTRKMTLVK